MILATSGAIEGQQIKEYLGIVATEVIIGSNALRDMVASVRDFIGGNVGTLETALADAREEALDNIAEKADALGANAIVGINIDYETLGQHGTILMVCVNGTAVALANAL